MCGQALPFLKLRVSSVLLLGKRVVEFLHRDLSVAVVVEDLHKGVLFMVSNVDVHASKTFSEFTEVNQLVVVFVELLKDFNCICLKIRVVLSWCFDLRDDCLKGSLRENITIILHILLCVLI